MIEKLKQTLKEVKEYRAKMHEGTTSVLVDNWIETTESVIAELSIYFGGNNDSGQPSEF